MGRRSTKTTKTGKFMNPTDQWRKELRRKELKKNKKQRTVVREAVLRMKDPIVILKEIEEIEKAESEAVTGSTDSLPLPNEKGLLEKKRKLRSNLDRIVKYWQKEDPKKAHDVKQLILDSENKRRETTQLHDSYREARSQCEVSDIPLPDTSDGKFSYYVESSRESVS
jgi:WW domain-binding protein 11